MNLSLIRGRAKKKQYKVICFLEMDGEKIKQFNTLTKAFSRREAVKNVNAKLKIIAHSAQVEKTG